MRFDVNKMTWSFPSRQNLLVRIFAFLLLTMLLLLTPLKNLAIEPALVGSMMRLVLGSPLSKRIIKLSLSLLSSRVISSPIWERRQLELKNRYVMYGWGNRNIYSHTQWWACALESLSWLQHKIHTSHHNLPLLEERYLVLDSLWMRRRWPSSFWIMGQYGLSQSQGYSSHQLRGHFP